MQTLFYAIVDSSSLKDSLYQPYLVEGDTGPIPGGWKTIKDMLETRSRVVQFFDKGPYTKKWEIALWENVVETTDVNEQIKQLDAACTFERGQPDNAYKLLLNNHYTVMGKSKLSVSDAYNYNPYLYDRLLRCETELGKKTSFVVVDHWHESDVIKTIYCMNTEDENMKEMCLRENDFNTLQMISIIIDGGAFLLLVMYGCTVIQKPRQDMGGDMGGE